MAEEPLNPDLSALEAALAALAPMPAKVDRDRLMFLTGQAAAMAARKRRGKSTWLAAVSLAANVFLAVALGSLLARGPKATDRLVQSVSPPAVLETIGPAVPDTVTTAAECSYLRLRKLVLEQGVEALPNPSSGSAKGPAEAPQGNGLRDLLRELHNG